MPEWHQLLLYCFAGLAAAVWLSLYGYVALLAVRAAARRRETGPDSNRELPRITVLVPTLNEELTIGDKLADIARTEYPADRLRILVVDGGSEDDTRAVVERDSRAELLFPIDVRGKADQVNRAFAEIDTDIAVVTDADSVLEPSCVAELVRFLEDNPETAVVGAMMRPDTRLMAEHIHWGLVNNLWWLEGEALSAAGISGVCYACRPGLLPLLDVEATAEDIHLAAAAIGEGHEVRICRRALAREIRAPRTLAELWEFRTRRGVAYAAELASPRDGAVSSPGWSLARRIRCWHFQVTPKLLAVVALLGTALLITEHYPWPLIGLAALALPLLVAPHLPGWMDRRRAGPLWKVLPAAIVLYAVVFLALLVLRVRSARPSFVGGRR